MSIYIPEKKRQLNADEIKDILSVIELKKNIPLKCATSLLYIERKDLYDQLKDIKIYPNMIDELKSQIKIDYYDTQIQPGEAVGIIAGQSIGMQGTQLSLDSFHTSGSENTALNTGVPRLQEILNATKDPKNISCRISFTKKFKNLIELRRMISKYIIQIDLEKLIVKNMTKIVVNKPKEDWYESYNLLYGSIDYTKYSDAICYQLDQSKLYEYNINIIEIAKSIELLYPEELKCIFSSNRLGKLHIYVDITSPPVEQYFINKENYKYIILNDVLKTKLNNHIIYGIENITNIFYKKIDNKWQIITKGGEFIQLFKIPFVDKTNVKTNNLWDIYRTLGIEATREFLINEFYVLMPTINKSHISILIDRMLYSGVISSITRYTMRKDIDSVTRALSFEESLDNVLRGCIRTQDEVVNGVSGSILTGTRMKSGTGLCDIKIDINKLKKCL